MKYLRLLLLGFVLAISCMIGFAINPAIKSAPPISNYPVDSGVSGTTVAYYVDDDGPIAAYSCASIDCEVVTTFDNGAQLSVIGPIQGESLLPVRYQNTIVYVMDTWLALKPASPALSLSRETGGPSARCRDGWTSFSTNRRGTCSHHGGVKTWRR